MDLPCFRQSIQWYWSRATLLQRAVGCFLLIFTGLEIWRPCFFLTDDNLSIGLPFFTEMGRHLKNGDSPFFSDYLFGGHYNYLRDPGFFLWHPLNLLVSLLADTPGKFWMLDIGAFCNLLLNMIGFVFLAKRLRVSFGLGLSDARLLLYSLSYVFSTFALTTGSSWENYLLDASGLPWLALGILEEKWLRSLALISGITLHEVLGGQIACTISNGLFLSLFMLSAAISRRSFVPLFTWTCGNLFALVAAAPLLLVAWQGFRHSARAAGLMMFDLHRFSMDAPVFAFSFFGGNFTELSYFFMDDPVNAVLAFPNLPTLAASAASWCLIPALFSRSRWRWLEISSLSIAGVALVLIIRPVWISEIMLHLPLLHSMRWPFRELMQFQFFIHLFLVLRPQPIQWRWSEAFLWISLAAFLLPLPFNRPPTMNPLAADRALLFSGEADRFWKNAATQLKPGDQLVTIMNDQLWETPSAVPYTLMNTANFPAYFKIPSLSGYSTTAPEDQLPLRTPPLYWFGAFDELQLPSLRRERPQVRYLRLESLDPLKVTLNSPGTSPVDLTRDFSK